MITIIDDRMLDGLREAVGTELGARRFSHTLGVEREISRLAELYLPEKSGLLRAAALLHDLTKEYSDDRHLQIMEEHGIDTGYYREQSRKIYHSLTASLIIGERFPDFADEELLHAVSVHTTGCADMTLSDKLLYLADYIEDTRTFDDCVRLREFFWDGIARGEDKHRHLDRTLLLSFDMTIRDLMDNNKIISEKTTEARNALLRRMKEGE